MSSSLTDVRLVALYAWYAREWPQVEPRSFHEALQSMYSGRVPKSLWPKKACLDSKDARALRRLYGPGRPIAASERFLVHSHHAAEMARLDCAPHDERKIGIPPVRCFPEPHELGNEPVGKQPLAATFGVSAPQKQGEKIIDAFARLASHRPDIEFAVVGRPVNSEVGARYRSQAARLGIADRIHFTGFVHQESFRSWLRRATVAIQLRALMNGESSAAVADCLAAGVPTLVTDLGWARELPDSCVVRVPRDITAAALASEIARLLDDEARMEALRCEGIGHARNHSFATTAELLHRVLSEAS